MKKVLITGASGYIGKSLYEALKSKCSVTCISRKELDMTNSYDVSQYMRNRYFDIVIHCAVKGGSRLKDDNDSVLDENLIMYYNLYNNKSSFGKLIHFGSGAEKGNPTDAYGLSKSIIRRSILRTSNFYNIRIYGLFDENELATRFIKANIFRYMYKEPIIVHQDKFMDFYYMKDLITLVEHYIEHDNINKEIDCAYNEVYSLVKIANIINQLDSHKVEILVKNKEFGIGYYGDNQRPPIKLTGLENGIREVYEKLKSYE